MSRQRTVSYVTHVGTQVYRSRRNLLHLDVSESHISGKSVPTCVPRISRPHKPLRFLLSHTKTHDPTFVSAVPRPCSHSPIHYPSVSHDRRLSGFTLLTQFRLLSRGSYARLCFIPLCVPTLISRYVVGEGQRTIPTPFAYDFACVFRV